MCFMVASLCVALDFYLYHENKKLDVLREQAAADLTMDEAEKVEHRRETDASFRYMY